VPGHVRRVEAGRGDRRQAPTRRGWLVADVAGGRVSEVERRSTVTRLGRGVDTLRGTSRARRSRTSCAAVAEYVEVLERSGAEKVDVIATSAVRDADNGGAFIAELRERFALSARVLDGEEEARLTYLGATSERLPTRPTLVIDIGGGSTELISGAGPRSSFTPPSRRGSSATPSAISRPTPRPPSSSNRSPPTSARRSPARVPDGLVAEEGIAVAGTPTSLAAIEMELDPYDPGRVHGHELVRPSIQRLLSRLASSPLSNRAQIPGLHPDRAPTIVAGVVILIEAMRALRAQRITVSEHDILYGTAIAAASSDSGSSLPQ